MKTIDRIVNSQRWLARIVVSAANKFYWDDCFSRASSLAYTTLFALVPISAISFAIFSGFELGDRREKIGLILEQFLPSEREGNDLLLQLQAQVIEHLTNLADGVLQLGNVSVLILAFTGIALVNTIESALNVVWRVTSDRSLLTKALNFWAVITLGPLLLAATFYWYGHFGPPLELWVGTQFLWFFKLILPVATLWLGFTILYYRLPAAVVGLADAALGGIFASILFEIMKQGFAYYVSISKNYSNFYGVLVSIPLFLFWLYLIWVVILFGAEISYQAGSIKLLHGLRKYASELGELGMVLGLRILFVIGNKFQKGESAPSEAEIVMETGSDPVLVRTCLELLADAGLVTAGNPKTRSRSLLISPDKITIGMVTKAFHSKNYRERGTKIFENSELSNFLDSFRAVCKNNDPHGPMSNWTLLEILSASQEKV